MNNEDEKKEAIRAELRCLESELYFSQDYGDWKMNECKEYELAGKECPMTEEELKEYNTKRDEIRNRINELRKELENA